jgi:parallel beta-helix repeat protein
MLYTTNYNLGKPEDNDTADIGDLNNNADTIDIQLKQNADNLETHAVLAATETTLGHIMLSDLPEAKKTARFIVGTSQSGWTSDDCDYLCDGTDDQTEINEAITALPDDGGEIIILDGTYNITATIDVEKSNVSIRGNGAATILMRGWDSTTYEGVISLKSADYCKIQDLQIDGNNTTYTASNNNGVYLFSCSNNFITGVSSNNNGQVGINVQSNSDNNIFINNIANNNVHGIRLYSSSGNTITGNIFKSNSEQGIYFYVNNNNNCIEGNLLTNNYNGISIDVTCDNNTFVGNMCDSNSNAGMYIHYSSYNIVTGNSCNSNGTYGLYLNDCDSSTIVGNTCNSNGTYGLYLNQCDSNTIFGNTCNNNETYGLCLKLCSTNNITGNTFIDNDSGIWLTYYSDTNNITGNICIRGTGETTDYTTSQYTININGTNNDYNLISSNNCMGKAVVIDGGTSNTSVNNKYE